MAEDEKEEQERPRLENMRQERLVSEQRKRAFQQFSRLPQRQKSPMLMRYYIAGENLRSLQNNRVTPAPQTAPVRDAHVREVRPEEVPRFQTEPQPASPAQVDATDPIPSQQPCS